MPAGVLGVDRDGVVTVVNAAAERLLGAEERRRCSAGRSTSPPGHRAYPANRRARSCAGCIKARRPSCATAASASSTCASPAIRCATIARSVITLDDISELVTAQRTAAWADVARRIAHEIKNPLTPIQLSAERLKRRYGRHIVEGKDIFDQCTDTIIRQVDDIKRMVDEFSSFARMPKARLAQRRSHRLRAPGVVPDAGRSRRTSTFEDELAGEPVFADFDRRLISQALTNVLKNATEGIDAAAMARGAGPLDVSLESTPRASREIASATTARVSRARTATG